MFEEKISEAADALARKQLGIEKQENENRSDLPKMFVQISDVFQIELMEQLDKISANMMQKYNLTKISPEILGKIAEKIKEEAVEGRIDSISELSRNEKILVVAEKATERQIEIENLTELNEKDGAKLSGESELKDKDKFDKAMQSIRESSKTKNEIHNLFEDMTEENVSERRNQIRDKVKSEEYQKENEEFLKNSDYIMKYGTDEQKAQTLEELARREALEKRRNMTPEERRQKRFQVKSILFDFVVKAENNPEFDTLRNEIEEYFAEEYAFEDSEVLEIKEQLKECKTIKDLQNVALEKIISLHKEQGKKLINEEKTKEKLLNLASKRTWTKYTEREAKIDYSEYDRNEKLNNYYQNLNSGVKNLNNRGEIFDESTSKFDEEFTELYSNMLLEDEDKLRLMNLFKSLEENEEEMHMPYDLAILDRIKNLDKNFYYLALRQMKSICQINKNPTLMLKIEEVIEKEIKEQTTSVTKELNLRYRRQMTPEVQQERRRGVSGILQSFMTDCFQSGKSLEEHKNEILKYLKKEHALSEKEKVEFYENISNTKTKEEFSEVLLDKMEEIFLENGKKIDREKMVKKAKREPENSIVQRTAVRAKIVLDEQLYNQFLDFQDELNKGKTEDDEKDYDYGFIELIKEKDPTIYEILKKRIKVISKKRAYDTKLKRLSERMEALDKTDDEIKKEIEEENTNNANKIEDVLNEKRTKIENGIDVNPSTTKTSVSLFDFMTRMYDEKNGTENAFEQIKKEIFDYISKDMAFSIEETEKILNEVLNATRAADLGNIIAEKMIELSEKRGIPPKYILPNQIIGRAKERTQIKNLKDGENINRRSILSNKVYAKMFLNGEDREKVNELMERMSNTGKNPVYDFSILDKVKDTDETFYYSMIRSVGVMAARTGNVELKEKYDELIAQELMEKGYNDLDDFGKNDVYAKIVLDEGIYNRYKKLESEVIKGSYDGAYDEELIDCIKNLEPRVYTAIMKQIKLKANERNDSGLFELISKFEDNSSKKEEPTENKNNDNKRSILTVQNLTVNEIITAHSDEIDMFDTKKVKANDVGAER